MPNLELPKSIHETTLWNKDPHTIWMGSSLILRRNIGKYSFPSKLSPQDKGQILSTLSPLIENAPHFKGDDLSKEDHELLYEHFLFLRAFEEDPEGSGFSVDEAGKFLVLFNMQDHLEIRMQSPSSNWEESWNALSKLEDKIGKAQGFSFSPKFGYLTSDPTHCGTGLTICAYLHLPALIRTMQLEKAIENSEDQEVAFSGLSGDLMELTGDIVALQNNYCIGMSEEAIHNAIQNNATKLIGAEKTMRAHLKEEPSAELKDLISKAFGLLVHSYQLDVKEAIDLLSLMRLGLELGEIQNVSEEKLIDLFFQCRRGHLKKRFSDCNTPEEIAKKRATYLQEELAGIRLTSEIP